MKAVFAVALACAALAGCGVSSTLSFVPQKNGRLYVGSEVTHHLLGSTTGRVFITDMDQVPSYIPAESVNHVEAVVAASPQQMRAGWLDHSTIWVCPAKPMTSRKDRVVFSGTPIHVRYGCDFATLAPGESPGQVTEIFQSGGRIGPI